MISVEICQNVLLGEGQRKLQKRWAKELHNGGLQALFRIKLVVDYKHLVCQKFYGSYQWSVGTDTRLE